MRIAFLVNDVATEEVDYTTTRLAHACALRGHEVWELGIADFTYGVDERVHARGRRAGDGAGSGAGDADADRAAFLEGLQQAEPEDLDADRLDVLMLRNDPSEDLDRPWARTVGTVFGEILARRGVLVLNDPGGLSRTLNKGAFQLYPAEVRPETVVSLDRDCIRSFVDAHGGRAVLKPVVGSGGRGIFLVQPHDEPNVDQMLEAVARDGYVVAQEYLPEAAQGDLRVLVVNGDVLEVDGHHAAFRRVPSGGVVSNTTAGGTAEPGDVDDAVLAMVDAVRPKLVEDGVFLAALDVVGDRLLEVNVFSPAGLGNASRLTGVDFVTPVVEAMERKVEMTRDLHLPNAALATAKA